MPTIQNQPILIMASQVKKTVVDEVKMEKKRFALILYFTPQLNHQVQMPPVLHYVEVNADEMKVTEK